MRTIRHHGTAALCLCYASCILLLAGTARLYHGSQLRAWKVQQDSWNTLLQRYLALPEERRILARHYPGFRQGRASARSMDNHRLNWMGRLDRLSSTLHLSSLHYEIGPGEPWMHDGTPSALLFHSEMQLRIGLAHETDLLDLLAALKDYPHAWMRESGCQLRRAGDDIHIRREQANIHAECTLHWVGFLGEGHARTE